VNEIWYKAVGPVLIRTPLLPFELLNGVTDLKEHSSLIKTAVAIASTSLSEALSRPGGQLEAETDEVSKAQKTLLKYMKRMCSRPIPYGLFAGVALGRFSQKTDLARRWPISVKTRTRPDMSWLTELIQSLEKDHEVCRHLSYRANPKLMLRRGRVWLTQDSFSSERKLISIRATAAVEQILNRTSDAYVDFSAIARELSSSFGIAEAKAAELCVSLIDNDFLTSNLRFPLSIKDPLLHAIECLESIQNMGLLPQLKKLHERLVSWDRSNNLSVEAYSELLDQSRTVAPPDCKNLLQVDTYVQMEQGKIEVSELAASRMADATEILLRTSTNKYPTFGRYLRAFERRYNACRVVSLLELVDEHFGLGSPYSERFKEGRNSESLGRDDFLMALVTRAQENAATVVQLTRSNIEKLTVHPLTGSSAPLSLDAFFQIIATSPSSIDKGDFDLLVSPRVGDNCAGRTLGRFASLFGEAGSDALREIRAAESAACSACIFADISFWKQSRMANIALAPSACSYSVSTGGAVSVDSCNIPLSEILIGIENGRFYAMWAKTNQRIMVRPSNLLNHYLLPDELRFLFEISVKDNLQLSPFDWGTADNMAWLPRLVYERIILTPARWNVLLSIITDEDLRSQIDAWRSRYRVPDLVLISTGDDYDDSRLLLDLSKDEDMLLFCDAIRDGKRSGTTLTVFEYLPVHQWHNASGHHFVTELVASFVLQQSEQVAEQHTPLPAPWTHAQECLRPLGSDWIYMQLDCPTVLQEEIIVRIADFAKVLISAGQVDNWFFVRYDDNCPHVRLRFRIDPNKLYSDTLPMLCDWANNMLLEGVCSNIRFETYNREIERYGGPAGMQVAESLFFIDSQFVAEWFRTGTICDTEIFAILSLMTSLEAFGLDTASMTRLLETQNYGQPMPAAGQRFREIKQLLKSLLQERQQAHGIYSQIFSLCEQFKTKIAGEAPKLNFLREGELFFQFVDSFTHMHFNRLYGINNLSEANIRNILLRTLKMLSFLKSNA